MRRIARADRDLDAVRRVRQRLLARDRPRRRKRALLRDVARRIARHARDLRRADAVLHAFREREDEVHLAVARRDAARALDLDVEIAVVAVDFGELVAALRELVLRHGAVGEPAHRIPPRQVVDRLVELGRVERGVVHLPAGLQRPPVRDLHGVGRALEDVVRDLLARALVDREDDIHVVAGEELRAEGDLRVGIVLLLVGEADARGGGSQVGLAVEVAVLQGGLARDLRLAQRLVALDDERARIAHLALHVVRHLHAVRHALGIGRDLLELAGILERRDVARHRDGVIRLAGLHLAAARDE